jgi:hypothetical protein
MTQTFRFPWRGAAMVAALTLAACAEAPTAVPSSAAVFSHGSSAVQDPLEMSFGKCIVDPIQGIWEGQVIGDIAGDLRTELRELRVAGNVWHVHFAWIIMAGEQSFVADLSGILNLNTGRVVMNGRVADGYLEGARVHEEGLLIDVENSCFSGIIRIMPATAH